MEEEIKNYIVSIEVIAIEATSEDNAIAEFESLVGAGHFGKSAYKVTAMKS